jgi:hypothetical protein
LQPGGHGATRSFINPPADGAASFNSLIEGVVPALKSLATTLETTTTFWDSRAAWFYKGWFRAPADGDYKFYLSADDQVRFFLDDSLPFDTSLQYNSNLYADANYKGQSWSSAGFRQYERVPYKDVQYNGKVYNDAWG